MSFFAKVNNGLVEQVIAADPNYFESFVDSSPGIWLFTDPNTQGGIHYGPDGQPDGQPAVRANYAGIGYVYDSVNDVFYLPQPYPSWTISAPTWVWQPPFPPPNDGQMYMWDEATLSWIPQNSSAPASGT